MTARDDFQREAIRAARWMADVLMVLFGAGVFAWAIAGWLA